jgi:hypothetical protein
LGGLSGGSLDGSGLGVVARLVSWVFAVVVEVSGPDGSVVVYRAEGVGDQAPVLRVSGDDDGRWSAAPALPSLPEGAPVGGVVANAPGGTLAGILAEAFANAPEGALPAPLDGDVVSLGDLMVEIPGISASYGAAPKPGETGAGTQLASGSVSVPSFGAGMGWTAGPSAASASVVRDSGLRWYRDESGPARAVLVDEASGVIVGVADLVQGEAGLDVEFRLAPLAGPFADGAVWSLLPAENLPEVAEEAWRAGPAAYPTRLFVGGDSERGFLIARRDRSGEEKWVTVSGLHLGALVLSMGMPVDDVLLPRIGGRISARQVAELARSLNRRVGFDARQAVEQADEQELGEESPRQLWAGIWPVRNVGTSMMSVIHLGTDAGFALLPLDSPLLPHLARVEAPRVQAAAARL